MINKVIETIEAYKMLSFGDKVTVGISGGADSVALLLALIEIKEKFNISINAVHINHLLRGEEADRDQHFCEELCERVDIPLMVFRIDVKKEIANSGKSFEQGARDIRYKCFEDTANNGKIATAHNLDDVAETLVFNIARGCSLNGLNSIPAKRDNIIRPLINVSRLEIEQYLNEKNQPFVTDSTNLENDYTRNKIRHNVIPTLKEINPSFLSAVARLKENTFKQIDYFDKETDKLINGNVPVSKLKNLHSALLCEYVSKLCKEKIGVSLDTKHINECVNCILIGKNKRCQINNNNYFYIQNDNVFVGKIDDEIVEKFCFSVENQVTTPYNTYEFEVIDYKEIKNIKNVNNLFLNNAVDYDKICGSLIIRNRLSGDRLRLKNRKVNKLLKSVYNELKIPVGIRDKLAVLDCNGKLVWAEKVGVSDDFAVNKNTEKVLIIKCSEVD